MKNYRVEVLILLCSICVSLFSQGYPDFHFRKLQVNEGLSENSVYCILQDSKGFMWFATKDGLNRYDGNEFKIFRNQSDNKNSIGNNFIHNMIETGENELYISTDAGLYRMNTLDDSFELIDAVTDDNIRLPGVIHTVLQDKQKNIWIGGKESGIFIYNPQNNHLRKIKINHDQGKNVIWSIYEDASGTIWVGTRLGLLRYNQDTGLLDPIEKLYNASDNPEHEILSILEDQEGNLWLGTRTEGLLLYKRQTNSYASYLKSEKESFYVTHIRSIFQYDEKTLFIGSDDGLYAFDIEHKITKRIDIPQLHFSLSDQNVYSIYKDREGGIWIGTYFGGVNYLSPVRTHIETYLPCVLPETLSGKAVSQFCEDPNGNLWIATEDGGINYFDARTKKISQPIRTSYHNTHALLLDGDSLWIGTFSRGIDVYNIKTKSLTTFRSDPNDITTINDNCVFSLYKTSKGDIYVGTPQGLNRYNKEKNNFTRVKEVEKFIYDMKEDYLGNLWLATYESGPIRYSAQDNKWIHYHTLFNKSNSIVNSKLTSVHIDNQNKLIFTSEGNGIFIYDYKTDYFRNISETDGLPNNVTYGILDDTKGNWWISSNKGLICFHLSKPHEFKLYGKEDGLQSNQFNYKSSYKAHNGKFYFGGINGFNAFYPQKLSENRNPVIPKTVITQVNILGASAEQNEEIQAAANRQEPIKLPHDLASFTISYVSLSYISQFQNQYAYKLEGADAKWNYTGNNKNVTYVNLRPGKYTFKVKGSNNDGIWDEEGSQIMFEILPPLWLSTPAKIIYCLCFFLSVYFIFILFLRNNKKKQQQHLETYKTEQETLAFKSKIDFFTTIAHEIRTPLSLISAPLEEVIISGEGSPETKENISIIEKNCDRLTELINQLLDFRKMDTTKYMINPKSINLIHYINELYGRFNKTAQNKRIDFVVNLPEEECIIYSDTDALTKVVANLLTNALKYTDNQIILSLTKNKNNSYTISVDDNGKGIPDEYKNLIFDPFFQIQHDRTQMGTGLGLSLAKSMAEILNGQITVSDGPSGGCRFTFTFTDVTPIVSVKEKEDERPLPKEFAEQHTPENKSKILIIEDNLEMLTFIKNSLQKQYMVDTALNVDEALALLEKNSYETIISDIMMPGTDGITFTRKLKSDVNYNHIPIILLSAKTENATKIKGLHSGADVFIEKPFSISHLKAQIKSLLENRKTVLDAFNRSPLSSYSVLITNKNDEVFLSRLNEEIEKHIADEDFSVESLTDIFNISRSNLQRKLKSISGVTPGDYLRNYRLRKACKLLLETDLRINEIAYNVGFNSPSYFSKAFLKTYNMTPKEFILKHINKQKADGETEDAC